MSAASSGNLKLAVELYSKLINSLNHYPSYVNLSVIHRDSGHIDLARKVLLQGLTNYSNGHHLWHILSKVEFLSNEYASSIRSIIKAIQIKPSKVSYYFTLVATLLEIDRPAIALSILSQLNLRLPNTPELKVQYLTALFDILDAYRQRFGDASFDSAYDKLISVLDNLDDLHLTPLLQFKLAAHRCSRSIASSDYSQASSLFDSLSLSLNSLSFPNDDFQAARELWHTIGWNLGISLIKAGDFSKGWNLYNHGLRVRAPLPQKWQRALKKPFTTDQLPLWDGKLSLADKHLLILGEQAIGDTIMFMRLTSLLTSRYPSSKISIAVQPRLLELYKRSFPDLSVLDTTVPLLHNSDYDYQLPCGSLPAILLNDYQTPAYTNEYKLVSSQELSDSLSAKYQELAQGKVIVGISWRGGAVAKRIPLKSTSLEFLLPVLKDPRYFFVSLQYGEVAKEISDFNHKYSANIYFDPDIDSLKDIDSWFSQVESVDAVLTVANTTLHGAGSLRKPTCALISDNSDWRWLNHDVSLNCIWYDKISIVHQKGSSKWNIHEIASTLESCTTNL